MKPPKPDNEAARLEVLRRYNILDTPSESEFDDITRLAGYLCGTPVALITFVDENRQWFKSKIGLDISETSLDASFCAHAVLQPDNICIVPDALCDERFRTNPLVTSDPKIRFYAGVPLVTPEGYALGTLCVIDHVPRVLSHERIEALRVLARQAAVQLELKLNLAEHKRAQEELRRTHDELEARVVERTTEIVEANMALKVEIAERRRVENELRIVNSITQAMNRSFELEEIYKIALDKIVEQEYVDLAYIYLVDEAGNEAVMQSQRNFTDDYIRRAGRIPYTEGVTWKVINTGEILNVKDVQDDPDVGPAGKALGFRSMLGIPIALEGKTIGALWLLSYKERIFTKSVEEFLSSIGRQIAIAVARANLYRELSKKNRYETIISTVTRSVHQSINLEEVLKNAVDAINNNIENVDTVSIYLAEGEEAVLKVHKGLTDRYIERAGRIPYPKGYTWETIIGGKPKYCPDANQDNVIGPAGRELGIKSYLSMPIHSRSRTIGCINVQSFEKNAFDEEELKLLGIVARQIEAAISNAKQAEALRQSEERYRTLFDQSPAGVYMFDTEFKVTQCNERFIEILGSSHDKVIGLDLLEIKDQSFTPAMKMAIGGETAYHESFYEVTTSPTKLWLSVRFSPLLDSGGSVVAGMAVVEDVTQRKQTEEALQKSEEKFRSLVEHTNDWIWEIDKSGAFTYISPQSYEITGYEPGEILGKTTFDFMSRDEAERFNEALKPFISAQKPFARLEKTLIHKNGHPVILETSGAPVFDSRGVFHGYRGIARNITHRKKTEEELLKVQKLESLGVLAGGIAHDFNNLLTGILGNISLVKMNPELEHKSYKRLDEAERASLRARDLTGQLLTFSKGGMPIKRLTSIDQIITESVRFALRGSNVGCEFQLAEDLWSAEVDVGQITQVIHNLAINAKQAMPEGGVIKVRAENMNLEAEEGLPLKRTYVKIEVEDEGIGIPKEHLSRIFDPYFTTKHKGSGLGLAIVHSIIKNHDGNIEVESKIGAGTNFRIYLPVSGIGKAFGSVSARKECPIEGKGKILVMDDEELVRTVLSEMLNRVGYEVEFAIDGKEAIDLYNNAQKSGKPFDAVIMDLTVPGGMGGKEMIEKLLKIDPRVRAIVSSGYSNDPVMSDYARYGFKAVVTKPYKTEGLSKVIHEVINGLKDDAAGKSDRKPH